MGELDEPWSLEAIADGDPATYEMIRRADTVGVFQIESRAQMSMLPRLGPRCYYDLVIEVALVRPGPIQGQMVHPYLRRRNGEEAVDYPDSTVEKILGKTLGVPLFQEQAMQLAIECAGFSADEADRMRRAVTGFKHVSAIQAMGDRLIGGMIERGYEADFAHRVFDQIKGFSTYGFPESHAASFALLAYASAYLKCHFPAQFTCAMLNSQPMGFYQPAQLVRDAQHHGVEVAGVDVNCSAWQCTVEADGEQPTLGAPHAGGRLRLGLNRVKGLIEVEGRKIAAAVAVAREAGGGGGGGFASIEALWRASGVRAAAMVRLASADAFGSMGLDRQSALWHARKLSDEPAPLFDARWSGPAAERESDDCGDLHDANFQTLDKPHTEVGPTQAAHQIDKRVLLPRVSQLRQVIQDYGTIGLSLRDHPLSFLRPWLEGQGLTPASDLAEEKKCPQDARVIVAGLCLVRQRPASAKSITFMTLEDETAQANLVVYPNIFQRYRAAARHSTALLAHGRIDRQGQVVHVVVSTIASLDDQLAQLDSQARNYR